MKLTVKFYLRTETQAVKLANAMKPQTVPVLSTLCYSGCGFLSGKPRPRRLGHNGKQYVIVYGLLSLA